MNKRFVSIDEEQLKELKVLSEAFKVHMLNDRNAVTVVDDKGKIIHVNKWSYEIVDFPAEDVIGSNLRKYFPDSKLLQTMVTKKVERNEIGKGAGKPRIVNRTPLFDNEGNPIGAFSTYRDIEDFQQMEMSVRLKLVEKGYTAKYCFESISCKSNLLSVVIEQAKVYARSSSPVLIQGESGTGKEMFAQSIHNASVRENGPFVALNCTTLTESILESELFGYSEASFTGAKKGGKVGLFQQAHMGTIFLDEIGEMPLSFQAKLLRVIQEKEIRPVGSEKTIPIDVRIISATNKDLKKEVSKGNFRLDLMYRLNVLNLTIPPIRKRKEDIEVISRKFLKKRYYHIYSNIEKEINYIIPLLKQYDFPGNVRELENIWERLILVLNTDNKSDVSETILENIIKELISAETEEIGEDTTEKGSINTTDIKGTLQSQEKETIKALLIFYKGSKQKVAKHMSISISTLRRKMIKYGLS